MPLMYIVHKIGWKDTLTIDIKFSFDQNFLNNTDHSSASAVNIKISNYLILKPRKIIAHDPRKPGNKEGI